MTSLLRRVALYLILFLLALFLIENGYSPVLTAGITAALLLLIFALPLYYSMLYEKRIDRLDAFLRRQKKTPAIYVNYVFANRLSEEARTLMEGLLRKHKRADTQAVLKAAYGVFNKDPHAVRAVYRDIRQPAYRLYYEAYLLLEEGSLAEARELANTIAKPWMRYALLAEAEVKEGRHEAAVDYARKALNECRGVQYYALYKEYERTLPEALKAA